MRAYNLFAKMFCCSSTIPRFQDHIHQRAGARFDSGRINESWWNRGLAVGQDIYTPHPQFPSALNVCIPTVITQQRQSYSFFSDPVSNPSSFFHFRHLLAIRRLQQGGADDARARRGQRDDANRHAPEHRPRTKEEKNSRAGASILDVHLRQHVNNCE